MVRNCTRNFSLTLIFTGYVIIQCTNAQTVQNFGICQTPHNMSGTCISLLECDTLYGILEKGTVTETERSYLRSSQCGFYENQHLVCCPNSKPISNLLPKIPNCPMQFDTRIVGGEDAKIDDFPSLARIEYTKPDKTKDFSCGGSLINNRYVLTAAHCVKQIPEGWVASSVRLGEWDTRTNIDCIAIGQDKMQCADPPVDVAIETIIVHPKYDPLSRNQHDDISLLRLAHEIKLTQYIKAICLPQDDNLQDFKYEQPTLGIAGWGRTASADNSYVKQIIRLNAWTQEECVLRYSKNNITLSDSQMCAGGERGKDTCSGDSGGPLTFAPTDIRPYYILAGIASFGPNTCGLAGWPGVYTRVGKYIDWIYANVLP